jgi:hypothetical protein
MVRIVHQEKKEERKLVPPCPVLVGLAVDIVRSFPPSLSLSHLRLRWRAAGAIVPVHANVVVRSIVLPWLLIRPVLYSYFPWCVIPSSLYAMEPKSRGSWAPFVMGIVL